jgi:HlyD family secretion protein
MTSQDALRLYGNVDIREVQLAFRQPGRVTQMAFDEGDAVAAGARMASLDAQPYRRRPCGRASPGTGGRAELDKLRRGLRPQEITQAREALNSAGRSPLDAERNFQRQSRACWRRVPAASARSMPRAPQDQAVRVSNPPRPPCRRHPKAFARKTLPQRGAPCRRAGSRSASRDVLWRTPNCGAQHRHHDRAGARARQHGRQPEHGLQPEPGQARVRARLRRRARSGPHRTRHRGARRSDSGDKVYRGQIGFISPRAEFTPKTVETPDLRTDLVYRLRIVIDEADSDAACVRACR